jgi:hypothetical protein
MCKNKTTEQHRARYIKATVSGMRQEGGKEKGIMCDCKAASWKLSCA